MKKVLTTILIFTTCISLFGQVEFVQPDRTPRIFIQTVTNNASLGITLQQIVAEEISKELSCAKVDTRWEVATATQNDREWALIGKESHLEKIMKRQAGADFLISLSIFETDDSYQISGGALLVNRAKALTKNSYSADKKSTIEDFHKIGKAIAMDLVGKEFCPFRGTITLTTERTDAEIRERGNRCGKDNSGYFKGTIRNSYSYFEELVLEKKWRMQADGSLHIKSTEEKMMREINSNCVLCNTYDGDDIVGIDAGNYTSSDYTQTIKEEFEVNDLARLDNNPFSGKLPAEVAIKFDTIQGTYTIQVKAVSKKGSYIKSKITKHTTSCRKDDAPDEKVTNEIIVSVSTSFGPFKGKPTDKTLHDSKTETEVTPHDGGQSSSTYKVDFSFTR